ncbi:unnamed protein product [Chondrus crispus]|uniref:Uncharacterized protein n=1 Tax=Chondrus crispus TaxID=2769 RepID=R7Q3X8_CHOCR|nr:unnamed protein product [Chondrus crispus]CDF32729.1 unnamed protein product [Chondrus crispus]|eukprot:XP_005712500.1 unnamed protein product [Chondrus crispus]
MSTPLSPILSLSECPGGTTVRQWSRLPEVIQKIHARIILSIPPLSSSANAIPIIFTSSPAALFRA